MQNEDGAAAVDAAFFAALVYSDVGMLRALLTEDFLIVDVMSGGVTGRDGFLATLDRGELTFTAIEPAEVTIRRYGGTVVVVGRTAMRGSFQGAEFAAANFGRRGDQTAPRRSTRRRHVRPLAMQHPRARREQAAAGEDVGDALRSPDRLEDSRGAASAGPTGGKPASTPSTATSPPAAANNPTSHRTNGNRYTVNRTM